MHTRHVMSGGRYPVLRSIAILYVMVAALAVIGGVVGIAYTMVRMPYEMSDRFIISLGILAGTFFLVVTMLAVAEVLKLFIDVEHNTRMAIAAPMQHEPMASMPSNDGGRTNRLDALDEETAEAALLRGH